MALSGAWQQRAGLRTGRRDGAGMGPAAAAHRQQRCSRPQASSRRRELLAGTILLGGLGGGALNPPPGVAASASAVFHEVSVPVPAVLEDDPFTRRTPPTRITATGRIVAIGDIHGDMEKTIASLRLARVLEFDAAGRPVWAGGDTVVVQMGDVLDRGDVEIAILRLLIDLDEQAQRQGGALIMLNGNHESLNVCGDFRYVTPAAFVESAVEFGLPRDVALRNWEGCIQARAALLLPGGRVARMLARNPTVLIVNDTAFAHGGLLPMHVAYGLERMNAEVSAWMRRERTEEGFASPPFLAMGDGKSVMWNRQLSVEKWHNPIDRFHAAVAVARALEMAGAKRLVVGHTPQMRGANAECDGLVWRIDVGMSSGVLDAPPAVLEITQEPGSEAVCQIIAEADELASYDDAVGTLDV